MTERDYSLAGTLIAGMAVMFAALGSDRDSLAPSSTSRARLRSADNSPVIDTTKESKRARRRRLAREAGR